MKKILVIVILVVLVSIYAISTLMIDSAKTSFSWSFFSSKINSKGTVESELYSLEMQGNDGRLYKFNFENKSCIALATSVGVGLDCKDK